MSASAEVTDDIPDKVVVEMESAPEEQTDQTTSLQLENRLLRSEIESLNQEMASLVERARASQQGKCKFLFIYFGTCHLRAEKLVF